MATPNSSEHEFTAAENEVLGGFASAAIAWGILCGVAALGCLGALALRVLGARGFGGAGVFFAVACVVQTSLAISFIGAGRAFLVAVRTAGSDITHVMKALRFVSGAVLVQIGVAAVSIVLAVLAGAGVSR